MDGHEAMTQVVEERVETVLLGWSQRMGLRSRRQCMEVMAHVVDLHQEMTVALPLQVALATALWFVIKLREQDVIAKRGS